MNTLSINGTYATLASPAFEFVLETRDGLRAVAWTNRLTGRTLDLGSGPEVEFDLGLPDRPLVTPRLRVTKLPAAVEIGDAIEAVFELEAEEPEAAVRVTYRWDGTQPVLRKFVTITNRGRDAWNRLLNARLGEYATGAANLTGGELVPYPPSFRERAHRCGGLQGFPVYAGDEFLLSLAHPAGGVPSGARSTGLPVELAGVAVRGLRRLAGPSLRAAGHRSVPSYESESTETSPTVAAAAV